MTPSILVAAELEELLGSDPVPGHELRWLDAGEVTPPGGYLAIIPLLTRRIGPAEFAGLPNLKVVANCAVGVDNVDLGAARARGIIVTNTPGVLTEATADLTWALILAVARRLKEGQQVVAEGTWEGWHPTQLLGMELRGRVLGIVGAGRIGRAVGRRAAGFDMRLCYTSRSAKPAFEQESGARRVDFDGLLAESDVISLHLPSTSATSGIIDHVRFRQMTRVPLLINTARGDLIDEPALIEALERGRVGGVGLDVFPAEPHVDRRLVEHPRAVLLPHVGSATTVTRRAMATLAARNVSAVLAGGVPITPMGD